MVFASPIFLALFLPSTLALYYAVPRARRNGALMGASLPSHMMLRDSMAIPLVPLLAELFRRSLHLSLRDLDPALVLSERPDLLIDDVVERNIVHAAAHATGAPTLRR